MTDWGRYDRCPVCARTWQCVSTSWGRYWQPLKRPHKGRKVKRNA